MRQRTLGFAANSDAELRNMDDLVFKPRGEMGGEGVVVWSEADDGERAGVRR